MPPNAPAAGQAPWCWKQRGGLSILEYSPWSDAGIQHGFLGRVGAAAELTTALGVERILWLHQVHGRNVLDLRNPRLRSEYAAINLQGLPFPEFWQADGAVFSHSEAEPNLFLLKTADCLPILIKADTGLAIVHAGWRGLVCGVIEHTLAVLAANRAEVLIGPCAGPERYEVGDDVIGQIGTRCINQPTSSGRSLLDLARTAENILRDSLPAVQVGITGICTISDPVFHSFRRDGAIAGRNLSFLLA